MGLRPSVGALLSWTLAGLLGRLVYQMTVRHGQDLLEIEALQEQVRQLGGEPVSAATLRPPGLPVGSMLQDFELPDLDGRGVALHQFVGRRVLLIFFDPRCPYSTAMLPQLAALSSDPTDGRPVPLVLTTGDIEENRELFAAHSVRLTILRQDAMEVGWLYQVSATPAGYLVDEAGATASDLALGAEAVLALADSGRPAPAAEGRVTTPAYQSLNRSRLLRSGLPRGTHAPDFSLPRIDGGELSLAEYRGRRVLLVFSDPACGPCNALAPALEGIHGRSPDLQVLMISRGDLDANREKAAEHRLTFPVVLQRHWDTSRDYGMFATPIAYLIDEDGVIAADVAVGLEPIISLASTAAGKEVAAT